MTTPQFQEDTSGKIRWHLPDEKQNLNRQQVINALQGAGFIDVFIDTVAIDGALALLRETKREDTGSEIVIAERRDGVVKVDIDEPRMAATLQVMGPYGGKPISLKQCALALKAAQIAHGLDTAALNEIAQQAAQLRPGQTLSKVVARGTLPQHGTDAQFQSIAPTVKDRILSPRINADGTVDYHELGAIPMVRTNDPLVRRVPPTAGTHGVTVTGEISLARPGKNLPFTLLPGAQIAPNDANLLIAAMEGMPVLIDCGMSVEKVYQVRNVNAATGNVTFEGGVVVDGDVAAGFAVSADSDINIGGLVDSARIVAGNDVIVNTGISGSMTAKTLVPSAFITAGNTIWTPFAQFAELHANEGVIAMKLLLHCKISSLDWIKLGGDKPGQSKLMGGEIRAVNMIKVDTLGDPAEIKTCVFLLGDFAGYREKHKHLVQAINEKTQQLAEMETLRDRLKLKSLTSQQHEEMLKRIEATTAASQSELDEVNREMASLEASHQESCKRVRLIITRKAYPGVEITIGDRRTVLKEAWGPGTIQYGSDGLLFNRGDIHIPSTRRTPGASA